MPGHRFYIPPAAWKQSRVQLDVAESHHAIDVLRLQPGDRATVFNGEGVEASAEIVKAKSGDVVLEIRQQTKTLPLTCAITLGQAVPKGKNMELIIEKATELGAAAIVPLLSERTVFRCQEAEDAVKKKQKWQRTAIEACKQCGQNWVPIVQKPETLKAFFSGGHNYDLMLIASLQPDARHLKTVLAEYGTARPASVLVLVGPEGDFTPAEISLAKGAGCRPITLGPIILRTETAALYCLSALSHELLG